MSNTTDNVSLAKKMFIAALFTAGLIMGGLEMKRAMPESKEKRIYKAIEIYNPYIMEKRIGGLAIIDKRDGTKEKPSSADVMHRYDELTKKWGKKHLRVEKNELIVTKDDNTTAKILIKNQKERAFLKRFFGI